MRGLVLIVTLAAVLVGCRGRPSEEAGPDHRPTGSVELVLRVADGGGFVPIESTYTALPSFSLMGDGTVIVSGPVVAIYPGPALPNLRSTRVNADGVRRILAEARAAGLFGPDRHYDYPGLADASTTTFTLVAEGKTHRISAYALFEGEGPGNLVPPGNREARAKLIAFRNKLSDLRRWLPEGSLGPDEPFAFAAMRVYVRSSTQTRDPAGGVERQRKDWPLAAGLGSFGAAFDGQGTRCGVVEGADLDRLLAQARQANQLTLWRSDGTDYAAWFRPLLPDESGCPRPGA